MVDGETRDDEWPFGDGSVFPAGPDARAADRPAWPAPTPWSSCCPPTWPTPDPELVARFRRVPVLIARLEPAAPPPPGPQVGFAGIGKPWKVERALRPPAASWPTSRPSPTTSPMTRRRCGAWPTAPRQFGAGLVTTEKDWVAPAAGLARAGHRLAGAAAVFDDDAALDALLGEAGL